MTLDSEMFAQFLLHVFMRLYLLQMKSFPQIEQDRISLSTPEWYRLAVLHLLEQNLVLLATEERTSNSFPQ